MGGWVDVRRGTWSLEGCGCHSKPENEKGSIPPPLFWLLDGRQLAGIQHKHIRRRHSGGGWCFWSWKSCGMEWKVEWGGVELGRH